MNKTNGTHQERSHAILSASGSSRWLNCLPSARLEEEYGFSEPSKYADEGTTAHEFAEALMERDILGRISEAEFDSMLETLMNKETFNDEMFEVVPKYIDYCVEQFQEAISRTTDAIIEIEQKLDFSQYVEDGYGTGDCTIIADGIMEVIDLKYGRGVPVYAMKNTQLMLYGLGALDRYSMMYDIKVVRLSIVQPRINNISTWDITVDDLMDWAENELMPKAKLAYAGEGETTPGDWCKFCSVKNKCVALSEKHLELAKHDFKNPMLLTDEEIAEIIGMSVRLVEWSNSIHAYATNKAITEGKQWPGYKLVQGISRRKWMNEDIAAEAIATRMPGLEPDDIFNTKLKSITDIEKKVGKKVFETSFQDVVVKPQGKPTLVVLEDKRPALGLEQAKIDFED